MKKLINYVFILALVSFSLSCSNSYNDLFYQLNNNFVEVDEPLNYPNIGDATFNEEMMLTYFQYTVRKDTALCLSAPEGAITYEWLIELPNSTDTKRTLIKRTLSQSSSLYYIPATTIKVGTLYILTLKATTKEGTIYIDDAELIFYE